MRISYAGKGINYYTNRLLGIVADATLVKQLDPTQLFVFLSPPSFPPRSFRLHSVF